MSNNKPFFMIEITVTDGCNCNCSYCFENSHKHIKNNDEEERQLRLIKNACETIDLNKYSGITLSFWGGEPLLNFDYFIKLIQETYQYNFVNYHLYSNGTLYDKYLEFLQFDFIDSIKDRFHIQLSYDGEPHHSIKRNYSKDIVFKTAHLLKENRFKFDFKATLTHDMIDKLPEIWDSYYETFLEFDKSIRYGVTIDSIASNSDEETFNKWKKAIIELGKRELKFIKHYGFYLSSIFSINDSKRVCNVNNVIFLHTDGNIYSCHGCPYLINKDKFILGNTKELDSLFINKKEYNVERDFICKKCIAKYCAICHVTEIKSDDIFSNWSLDIKDNYNKCKYYKYLGLVNRIMNFILIKRI